MYHGLSIKGDAVRAILQSLRFASAPSIVSRISSSYLTEVYGYERLPNS